MMERELLSCEACMDSLCLDTRHVENDTSANNRQYYSYECSFHRKLSFEKELQQILLSARLDHAVTQQPATHHTTHRYEPNKTALGPTRHVAMN